MRKRREVERLEMVNFREMKREEKKKRTKN